MRRASLAGLDTQAPGGSFVWRPGLSTLGSGKYKLAFDSYGDRERVIVRHVPIVIEGSEGESEEEKEVIVSASVSQSPSSPLSYIVPDDLSSLSSLSSDNSVEKGRRKDGGGMEGSGYQSLDEWRRKRGRKHGVVDMRGDRQLKTPFKDIKQSPEINQKMQFTRPDPTAMPGPWYLLKTETVGVESCPVHAEGNKYRKEKEPGTMGHTYGQLRAPSLIQGRTEQNGCKLSGNTAGRPKHSIIATQPGKTGESEAEIKRFERGPGQWSFRGISSKPASDGHKDEKETMEESRKFKPTFQRQWSFRSPSVTPSRKSSFHAPTIASLSRSQLNRNSSSTLTALNSRSTPSSSTCSIHSKITQHQITRDNSPSPGILKSPGKRKVSSNNRVEFLSNIMEREIPGRHT